MTPRHAVLCSVLLLAALLVLFAGRPVAAGTAAANQGSAGAASNDSIDDSGAQPEAEPAADEASGSAGADEDSGPIEFPPEILELLTQPSEGGDYPAEERCITTRNIRRTHILDDRHIVFESAGSAYHLVQSERRCPRLNKHSTLIYEARDNRLCRLDMIRPANGTRDVSAPCSIPGFIPITGEQMVLLKETLAARRAAAKG